MKKWFATILLLQLFFTAIVPCSFFDNCEEDTAAQQTGGHPRDCSDCSPFSGCATAHAFVIQAGNIAVQPEIKTAALHYQEYSSRTKAGFRTSLLQPPRMG